MIRSIHQCNFYANRSSGLGGVVRHTYTRKLVYAALSMHDAQYQTCLWPVLITLFQQISAHLLTMLPILLSQSSCKQNVQRLSNVALNKSHFLKNSFSSVYLYRHRIIFGRTTKLGPPWQTLFLDPQSTTLIFICAKKTDFPQHVM